MHERRPESQQTQQPTAEAKQKGLSIAEKVAAYVLRHPISTGVGVNTSAIIAVDFIANNPTGALTVLVGGTAGTVGTFLMERSGPFKHSMTGRVGEEFARRRLARKNETPEMKVARLEEERQAREAYKNMPTMSRGEYVAHAEALRRREEEIKKEQKEKDNK